MATRKKPAAAEETAPGEEQLTEEPVPTEDEQPVEEEQEPDSPELPAGPTEEETHDVMRERCNAQDIHEWIGGVCRWCGGYEVEWREAHPELDGESAPA